jgi:hypothetical protein
MQAYQGLSSLIKANQAFPEFFRASSLGKAFPFGIGLPNNFVPQ